MVQKGISAERPAFGRGGCCRGSVVLGQSASGNVCGLDQTYQPRERRNDERDKIDGSDCHRDSGVRWGLDRVLVGSTVHAHAWWNLMDIQRFTAISVEGCVMVSEDSYRYSAHRTTYRTPEDAQRAAMIFILDLPDDLPEAVLFWPLGGNTVRANLA